MVAGGNILSLETHGIKYRTFIIFVINNNLYFELPI